MTSTLKALLVLSLAAPALLSSQTKSNPLKHAPRPTTAAITPADLMTRVYIFADDSMMGRATGTVYHDKATDYIARELKRIGLRPAGDSGTFFQSIPVVQRTLAANTTLSVDGRAFAAWTDFLPRDPGAQSPPMNGAAAVYGGVFGDSASMIRPAQAAGKVAVFTVPRGWQANRGALALAYRDAAGIVVMTLDSMPAEVREALAQPLVGMAGGSAQVPPVPFFYATNAMARAMFGGRAPESLSPGTSGSPVTGSLVFTEAPAPGARNVVAVLPGRDPALRGQYVAIGSHSDHEGWGEPIDHDSLQAFYRVARPRGADDGNRSATADEWTQIRALLDTLRSTRERRIDSIFNGADDDASGSMAMLEVAEAFAAAREKPRRSILFVWHVAEEQGLLGARHFTDNPTVPRDSIVGQINIDMIGRGGAADLPGGGPGYLQVIGARRLSTQLGDIVDEEGKRFTPAFRYDYQFDANGHPSQFYCRSDHYMYARYGIPVVFFSSGGHPEYHQVTDEPQYIDYDALTRVSQLVYNTAARIANLDGRLVVDRPKPDPNGRCVQ